MNQNGNRHNGPSPLRGIRHFVNRVQLARSYLRKETVVSGFPAHLKIELTNYCNLRCPMCPLHLMEREVDYMDAALFRKILDEAAGRVEFAYLHFLGESLFHPELGEIIAYGKSKGVALGLSTNGTALTERKAREVLESGLDFMIISFDGATKETYEKYRLGANFEKTIANVRRFFELKRQVPNSLTAVVQMLYLDETQGEVEKFRELWSDVSGARVMVKKVKDWGGALLQDLAEDNPQTFVPKTILQAPCSLLWMEISILWDGSVVPCSNTYDKTNLLGNVLERTIAEIWNGPAIQEMRRKHVANTVGEVPICNTCPRFPFEFKSHLFHDQLSRRIRQYAESDGEIRAGLS